MSKKIVLLTVLYFGSFIPYSVCLPQNCPCGKSQFTYSGPPQFVLARPWSGYRVDSPTYLPFPLVISRGTRAIKSAIESPEEPDDKKFKKDLPDLEDDKDLSHDNIKPRSATPVGLRHDKESGESPAAKDKPEKEVESLSEEEEVEEDNQAEIDRLNFLGQLFQVLALQYQKVFGGENNLRATNSSSVKSDDDLIEDYADYSYDSVPATQIDRPETEQEVAKKEKRKVEEEKTTNSLPRINYNGTTTVKPFD